MTVFKKFVTLTLAGAFALGSATGFAQAAKKSAKSSKPTAAQTQEPAAQASPAPQVSTEADSFEGSMKSANIRMNPFFFLLGFFNFEIDIGVLDSLTVGPILGFYGGSLEDKGYMLGGRLNVYVSGDRFVDGWYVSPFGYFLFSDSSTRSIYNVGAVFGYGWFWESGFNMKLGFGGALRTFGETEAVIGPSLDWTLGVAF